MFLMYKQYADKNPDKMGRGEGAVPTKGVGGYRPTTNWREISVRRRSVAARQVLACIIVSGVVIVAAGILLTVLGFLVIASQCPFMWREGAGSCYYLAPHNATWEEGRSYCTSQSAALLHLHSRTEADFITEVMSGRSWLGARRKRGRDNVWAWTDSGKTLNYTRWTGSEPASLQQDLCAAVEPGGAWLAVACRGGDTAYVICDYVPGYNPFMLVGPVVAVCGVVVLVLSVEVCVRRREFITKNPEAITDDQDDDRQVDPGIINYGYGHFEEEEAAEQGRGGGGGGQQEAETQQTKQPTPRQSLRAFASVQKEGGAAPSKPNAQTAQPRIQTVVVSPSSEREKKEEEEKKQEEEEEEEESAGPKVEVVPASPSSLSPPSIEENSSPSQENLELLLSPKTLE